MSFDDADRRMAVILAADLADYSRLVALDEEATLASLATYQGVIDSLIAEHRGRVFSRAGDGLLAEFASAVQAARCAVAIQRMVDRRNHDRPEAEHLLFRIGINLGDVVVRGNDLLGDTVNVATRLQGLAEPGQIVVAATVQEQLGGKVSFPCEALGEVVLKNIPRGVSAHRLGWALDPPPPPGTLRTGSLPLPDRPSIAVLPFANLGGDSEQDYFAEGLSEDLITALAKYRWFFVIARNSSFTYRGRNVPVRQVGRELGVRYVLEGSVRRSGNRLRVTAQLVEATTGHHLWAERFDRDLADLFALQDDIVERVIASIEPGMLRSETDRARRATPSSLNAWDLLLRGMWQFHLFRREHHHAALDLFRRASATDPSLAEPHLWRVRCLDGMIFFGWSDDIAADDAEEAEALRQGLRLAEADPYACYAQAIYCNRVGQSERAIEAAQRAIDLSPSFALGHFLLGTSRIFAGRAAQAIEPLERGLRLSPADRQSFVWLQFLAWAHYLSGGHASAIERAREAVSARPDVYMGHMALACGLASAARLAEAHRAMAELRQVLPSDGLVAAFIGRFALDTDRVRIVGDLRRAGWTACAAGPDTT
ncbi:MAG: adenylate/guanylate cyclase domain-containing protein [Geminicoccaceae bacterium]